MLKLLEITGDFAVATALVVGIYKAIGIEWTWPLIAGLGVSGFCLSFGCVVIEVWRKLPVDRDSPATPSRPVS